MDLLNYAKENEFAIPGVNVVSSSSVNACMEAAKKAGGPVMVTFSRGGGQLLGSDLVRHLVLFFLSSPKKLEEWNPGNSK